MNRGSYNSYFDYSLDRMRKTFRDMSREKKRLLIYCVLTLTVGLVIGRKIGGLIEKKRAEKELVEVTAQIKEEEKAQADKLQEELDKALEAANTTKEGNDNKGTELPWYLVLVNNKNPMDEDYEIPSFTDLQPGYSVDSRIAEAANQMLQDAKADGMKIIICSAYRSVGRQEELFNTSLQDRLNSGLDYWDAFAETRQSVAEPGTSEHALGLALDLISNDYMGLDEKQQETEEAQWLAQNCHKYGFILRYPPEKTEITGIIYEPWHYRYVGVEDATKIMELGITLEEYLEEYY